MSDEEEECDCPAGAPGWLATFADLMSLLMCFFVLLLSFSEMNVPKFKQASGSLKNAFGVQRVVMADAIPKGNSTIMTEFSPGKPDLVQFDTLAQDFQINVPTIEEFEEKKAEEEEKIVEEKKEKLEEALQEDIAKGSVELEKVGKNVVLRIKEQASFPSGSDKFQKKFIPTLQRIMKSLRKVQGKITVAGHTDDVPINTGRFRSNWDLSSSRAVTVTQSFIRFGKMPKERFEVRGHADTQPLVKNRDAESRAKNRRVEIVIGMDKKEILERLVEKGYIEAL